MPPTTLPGPAPDLHGTALAALTAGLCPVPPREDGSKAPIGVWKQYQQQRPSREQVDHWYASGNRYGIGLVCGRVSGNLECLEFETEQVYREYVEAARNLGLGQLVERVEAGYLERAPRGGYHWLYRCPEGISGNLKLASTHGPDGTRVLIETRGEGGYVITAPTHGPVHPSGRPYTLIKGDFQTITTISAEDRAALHQLARSFDRTTRADHGPPAGRPGDDFEQRASWADILTPHGWTRVLTRGEVEYWRRPGKQHGHSATIGHVRGQDGTARLYVFSTAAAPFEAERSYSKFAAYAVLNHGGDYKAAARALADQGYGAQEEQWERATVNQPWARSERPWPELDPAAYHGLAGDVVALLEPHTEADPVALLALTLSGFGLLACNADGTAPHLVAGGTEHPPRIYPVLVGRTAKARKGTAQRMIDGLLDRVEWAWMEQQCESGLVSGEGLIERIKDPDSEEDGPAPDKRLWIVEEEFARVLQVAQREGSVLSAIIRQAWDGRTLSTLGRKKYGNRMRATRPQVVIVGHITLAELQRYLTATEQANGFANRFLYVLARRSKLLPEPSAPHPAALNEIADRLARAVTDARRRRRLDRTPAARERWAEIYRELAVDDDEHGLAGMLLARAEAHVLRLSLVYALLDQAPAVDVPHLEAALALWRYCEASAWYVFGDQLGDDVADRLLDAIRRAGPDGLDGSQQRAVFSGHVAAPRLEQARALLERRGLIVTEHVKTKGRPRTISRAVSAQSAKSLMSRGNGGAESTRGSAESPLPATHQPTFRAPAPPDRTSSTAGQHLSALPALSAQEHGPRGSVGSAPPASQPGSTDGNGASWGLSFETLTGRSRPPAEERDIMLRHAREHHADAASNRELARRATDPGKRQRYLEEAERHEKSAAWYEREAAKYAAAAELEAQQDPTPPAESGAPRAVPNQEATQPPRPGAALTAPRQRYQCATCGFRSAPTCFDMTGTPHPGCGGRFRSIDTYEALDRKELA